MNETIILNMQKALQVIWPLLISLLALLATSVLNNIRNKIKEKNSIAALEIFDKVVEDTVKAVNQKIVKNIRRRGRNLNEKEKVVCKKKATDNINFILSNKTKKDIKYIVKDIDSYIDSAIEGKVVEQKIRRL
jgi:hypothetical protein